MEVSTITIIASILIPMFAGFGWMISHIDNKIEKQSERTDKLYEMFIDLLKIKRE